MDLVGTNLLQRVRDLLATRADMSRQAFGVAIKRPTPSWISEFFAGKRTTNDLRLVLRMARVLRVPVSYLLNEAVDDSADAQTLSLIGAWRDLGQKQRNAVLRLALDLQDDDDTGTRESAAPSAAAQMAGVHTGQSREPAPGRMRR